MKNEQDAKRVKQSITSDFLKDQYRILYEARSIIHPRKGKLKPYGAGSERDEIILSQINEFAPDGAHVLDASCGRGRLLRMLLDAGYDAQGTEICDCLFEPGGSLHDLPARCLDYEEIGNGWDRGYFDVVVSNDVLEHLYGFPEVRQAISSLVWLTKKNGLLVLSIGLGRSPKYCTALGLGVSSLHTVRGSVSWGVEELEDYGEVIYLQAKPDRNPDNLSIVWRVR